MKFKNLFFMVGGVIAIICVGIWLYVEWDLKQFRETLPSPPQRIDEPQAERLEKNTLPEEVVNASEEQSTEPIVLDEPEPEKEITTADAGIDVFLNEIQQITELPVTSEDDLDSPEADVPDEDLVPFDAETVKAGFNDYNAYLNADPEYAYQRLDDAFREQFGNSADVDILVESIRSYNEGPVPVDTAIEFMEAELRLQSQFGYPEPMAELQDNLEMLREARQYALESGEVFLYRSQVRIDGEH